MKSPLTNQDFIISYFGPVDALAAGQQIDAEAAGYQIHPWINARWKLHLTRQAAEVINDPTGQPRPEVMTSILNMYRAEAQAAPIDADTIYLAVMIDDRIREFKAVPQPMNARPNQAGHMLDPQPVLCFSLID